VFKLIGPVLVRQELMEVKNNVTKRIEFIKNDMCAPPHPTSARAYDDGRRTRAACDAGARSGGADAHALLAGAAAPGWRATSRSLRARRPRSRRTSPICRSRRSKRRSSACHFREGTEGGRRAQGMRADLFAAGARRGTRSDVTQTSHMRAAGRWRCA
jgi:hypothetical protein